MRICLSKRRILIAAFVAVAVAAPLGLSAAIRSAGSTAQASAANSGATTTAAAGPVVKSPAAFGTSAALRNIAKAHPASKNPPAYRLGESEAIVHPTGNGSFFADPVVQQSGGGAAIPPTSSNFDGNNIGESSSD